MQRLRTLALGVVIACGFIGAAHAGTILSNNPLVPTGLTAGQSFRFVFVTSGTTQGTSGDISYYNAFAQAQAEASTSLVKNYGWQWKAIVSVTNGTTTTTAKANTGTTPSTSGVLPIYRLDGVKIVNDYTELWTPIEADPLNSLLQNVINVDQSGTGGIGTSVWTGTQGDGLAYYGALPLGANGVGDSGYGITYNESLWVNATEGPLTNYYSLYAMSEEITIEAAPVPEIDPAGFGSIAALVTGALGFIERRRLKAKAA